MGGLNHLRNMTPPNLLWFTSWYGIYLVDTLDRKQRFYHDTPNIQSIPMSFIKKMTFILGLHILSLFIFQQRCAGFAAPSSGIRNSRPLFAKGFAKADSFTIKHTRDKSQTITDLNEFLVAQKAEGISSHGTEVGISKITGKIELIFYYQSITRSKFYCFHSKFTLHLFP